MIKERISFDKNKPKLYLVSTPIGNLKDITYRAVEVFKWVDIIYAEDTRLTSHLLHNYGIKRKVESYHKFNEKERTVEIIEHLDNGLSIAFCTDAGTPAISDPGYYLVSQVKDKYPVVPIPGASALLAALVASGLVPQPFTFIGFTDKKSGKRINDLRQYKSLTHTLVFYERAERVVSLCNDLFTLMGKRKCVLAKELTKIYETFYEFELGDDLSGLTLKGEFVVMISGYEKETITDELIINEVNTYIDSGYSTKDAIKIASKNLDINKNYVYDLYIKNKDDKE